MPAVDTPIETESERVERWRTDELIRVGFEPDAATVLAAEPEVDLHRAIELIEQGCPPDLALRILL